MSDTIKRLSIEGFKSIRSLRDFELSAINVLIGPNGAGKSNFVSFFRLLRELIDQRLQIALATTEGGADACLYLGPRVTKEFRAELLFGNNGYEFTLVPTPNNQFAFADEITLFDGNFGKIPCSLGSGHVEARLKTVKDELGKRGARRGVPSYVYDAISRWVVYHFHDTSLSAGIRRQGPLNDNEVLRPDAQNLAAFLYRIRQTDPEEYQQIRDAIRLAAPFFDDFKLRPVPTNSEMIQLEWQQKDSDYPFRAHQLSDGTLRFMCLATALLQPLRPATMLFDEPELGLHPYALTLLGNLFKQAAETIGSTVWKQVIISTQSAPLLSEFEPEDVIIVERHNGESTFQRLDAQALSEWLTEYSLGELWQKNLLGGRPRAEDRPHLVPNGDN
jgi:predicted ATPase